MPPPGGDVIGRRRLDPHIHAFAELGAEIELGRRFEMSARDGLRGKHVFLDEASVMATENAVMAAVLTPGETVVGNAACEPHVQDLCRFLVSLGADIEGIESNVLRIRGVESLRGGEWRIGTDHIEVASFIGLAAITGGGDHDRGASRRRDLEVDPAGVQRNSACRSRCGTRACTFRPGSSSSSRTTSAGTSRRSRTGPGRRSRPT